MTTFTPSMVIDVSAAFVVRITFFREEGATARSWASGARSPWSDKSSNPAHAAIDSHASATARISFAPERNTRT